MFKYLEDAFVERYSTAQASFRRKVGFGGSRSEGRKGCSDDSRFLDTIILSHPVCKARSLQEMCQIYLGDPYFPLAWQGIGNMASRNRLQRLAQALHHQHQ